jgi:thiol-disulfide isomerase/thioredoxin
MYALQYTTTRKGKIFHFFTFFDTGNLILYNLVMKKVIISATLLFLFLFGVMISLRSKENPTVAGKLDTFARCLTNKGVKFYGAFWCPHCQAQKALFGSSAKLLPYIECSTPDAQGRTAICDEKKIEGYPTWEFFDGTREGGEITLSHLSEKTSCPLPPKEVTIVK